MSTKSPPAIRRAPTICTTRMSYLLGMAETSRHCSFSHHCDGCTLRIMRNRPANWVITALLMVQLAIGLQWQGAHAAAAPERQMNGMKAGHCASHQSNDSSTIQGGAGASTSAP